MLRFGSLVPVHITIVPLFLGLAKLRLTDTYCSLIMPTVANGFGIFLLQHYFVQGIALTGLKG